MSTIDLVFEGGGAKGMLFIGALEVLFEEAGHTHGRLLGTSAGAITALALAAGYTIPKLNEAITERDEQGRPVFVSFLQEPPQLDDAAIRDSEIRRILATLDLPVLPGVVERRLDNRIAERLAGAAWGRNLFSFLERGGWYAADNFVQWAVRMLNRGQVNGQSRQFGDLTLKELFEQTHVELTLVAADTTWARILWLNHRTAPDCPAVWAARMSMSVPFIWPEVEWQHEWGPYFVWNPTTQKLEPKVIDGHLVVDGGLLSNFPIALFMADSPDVTAVVGSARTVSVLGLLIDEARPVPGRPTQPGSGTPGAAGLRSVNRLHRLVNTATGAHDNMAKVVFAPNVVRLPAGGYGTTQFDMTDEEREILVNAGREAMRDFLSRQPDLATDEARAGFALSDREKATANRAALDILGL